MAKLTFTLLFALVATFITIFASNIYAQDLTKLKKYLNDNNNGGQQAVPFEPDTSIDTDPPTPILPCIPEGKVLFRSFTEEMFGLPAGCRACDEIFSMINVERQSFVEHHAKTCYSDSDCTTAPITTPFRGGCYAPVLTSKEYIWNAWQNYYFEEYEFNQNIHLQYAHAFCGYLSPRCAAPNVLCNTTNGRCEFKPLEVIQYDNEPVVGEPIETAEF